MFSYTSPCLNWLIEILWTCGWKFTLFVKSTFQEIFWSTTLVEQVCGMMGCLWFLWLLIYHMKLRQNARQSIESTTYLYKPVLKGFFFSFCFCFKASVLKSFISCSAVISLCRPRGIRCTSLGLTPSYSRGNFKAARSCVATVARVRCSHRLSCSLVCIRNKRNHHC